MVAAHRVSSCSRFAATIVVVLGLLVMPAAPALAVQPPAAALNSTTAILGWINAYRHRPDPDKLPEVVHTLTFHMNYAIIFSERETTARDSK